MIHLFLNAPRLDVAHVEPIFEDLHDREFEYRRAIIGEDAALDLAPPQPGLADPAICEIVQAKAKCNEDPDEATRGVLAEWAAQEGLKPGD